MPRQMNIPQGWLQTLAPVDYADEQWTHVKVSDDSVHPPQILLARMTPSGIPEKVCRLWWEGSPDE